MSIKVEDQLASREIPIVGKFLFALMLGAGSFIAIIILLTYSTNLIYQNKVIPGVSVSESDLSGLSMEEAELLLHDELSFAEQGNVVLQYGEREWSYKANELGFQIDYEATLSHALSIGKQGLPWERLSQQIQSLRGGYSLSPRITVDGLALHKTLENIAGEINQEKIEAELFIDGLEVEGMDGQIGIALDTEKTAQLISAFLLNMEDAALPIVVYEEAPRILSVSEQTAIAKQILSNELRIKPGGDYADNPDAWVFSPQELADMLSIERVEGENEAFYQIALDSNQLASLLASWAPLVVQIAENPRFIFNDDTRELDLLQDEIIGRTLEIEASIEHINEQVGLGQHEIELQYDLIAPPVREDMSASDLGISELVNAETSYFYGSSSARMQNIQTASERFHGLLVPPGATFSMVENIGDISLDSGFAEALIIYGDRTIKGVGGGVCQVSTTLFRNVFFSGFPVVERNPHAYRVYYYELAFGGSIDPLSVGLDATVYAPIVDFKFKNDTDYWLLMETYVDLGARSLTWKFYSTSDGRVVEWDNSGVQKVVEAPEPIYEENDELDKGEVKQVDWAADGANVTVVRSVIRNGEILFEDEFKTQYRPWAAVYQYGPGTPGYPPDSKKPVD